MARLGRWVMGDGRAGPPEPATRTPATDHPPCSIDGCPNPAGARCPYQDSSGERCGWWCDQHLERWEDKLLCRRHASSLRELSARKGSIYELKRSAEVHDRRPHLVSLVVDSATPAVESAVRACFKERGLSFEVDPAIRETNRPRARMGVGVLDEPPSEFHWQRGWGLSSPQGYVWRATVVATGDEPPVVHVIVDGKTILAEVPSWIALRGTRSDPELRSEFSGRIAQAITDDLDRGQPSWMLDPPIERALPPRPVATASPAPLATTAPRASGQLLGWVAIAASAVLLVLGLALAALLRG